MTRPKPFPKLLGRSSLNWMKVTAKFPNPIHMNLNNLTTNDWKIAKPRLLSEQEFPYLMQDSIHVPVTRTSSIIHISYAIGGGPIRHVPFYGIPFPVSRLEPIPLIPALSLSPKDQRLLFGLDKQAGTGSSSRYHYNGEAHLPITGGELKGSKLLRSCFVSLKLWNLSRLTSTNLSLPDQVDHYRNPYRTRCFLGFASFWQRRPSPYALRDWAFGSHLIGLLSAVAEKCPPFGFALWSEPRQMVLVQNRNVTKTALSVDLSPSYRTSSKQQRWTSSCWTGHWTTVYCFSACFGSLKRQTSGDYETACYWASCVPSFFIVGSAQQERFLFFFATMRRRLHWFLGVGIVGELPRLVLCGHSRCPCWDSH